MGTCEIACKCKGMRDHTSDASMNQQRMKHRTAAAATVAQPPPRPQNHCHHPPLPPPTPPPNPPPPSTLRLREPGLEESYWRHQRREGWLSGDIAGSAAAIVLSVCLTARLTVWGAGC